MRTRPPTIPNVRRTMLAGFRRTRSRSRPVGREDSTWLRGHSSASRWKIGGHGTSSSSRRRTSGTTSSSSTTRSQTRGTARGRPSARSASAGRRGPSFSSARPPMPRRRSSGRPPRLSGRGTTCSGPNQLGQDPSDPCRTAGQERHPVGLRADHQVASHMGLTYLDGLGTRIRSQVPEGGPAGREHPRLFRIYAALLLAKGVAVTAEDVHNAWAAWMGGPRRRSRSACSVPGA